MEQRALKILLVDDEEIMIALLHAYLSRYCCSISIANGGRQALRLLETNRFDLVITDLQMGEIGGLEVVQAAKKLSPRTKVFVMTGCREVEPAIAAFRAGADDYLLKPFPPDLLPELARRKGCPLRARGKTGVRAGMSVTGNSCQPALQAVKRALYS